MNVPDAVGSVPQLFRNFQVFALSSTIPLFLGRAVTCTVEPGYRHFQLVRRGEGYGGGMPPLRRPGTRGETPFSAPLDLATSPNCKGDREVQSGLVLMKGWKWLLAD